MCVWRGVGVYLTVPSSGQWGPGCALNNGFARVTTKHMNCCFVGQIPGNNGGSWLGSHFPNVGEKSAWMSKRGGWWLGEGRVGEGGQGE